MWDFVVNEDELVKIIFKHLGFSVNSPSTNCSTLMSIILDWYNGLNSGQLTHWTVSPHVTNKKKTQILFCICKIIP
jgi:hypothetical protein